MSGLDVVCFLVSLSPNHENPSGCFSLNTGNLVKPVHASDNSRSPSTFQKSSICFSDVKSKVVSVVLVTPMYFSGKRNVSTVGTQKSFLDSPSYHDES